MNRLLKSRKLNITLSFIVAFCTLVLVWPLSIPDYPYSTVISDTEGHLLSAMVADDGQWRFPRPDSVPHRFRESIRLYEDEYFYWHPGINPASVIRAIYQYIKEGEVVSGASTITMQIARMARQNPRSVLNKLDEMMMALKLDVLYSKKTLMRTYVSMAPFGGNVVGLEAASWRYYGRPPHLLSWAESATLAVLPNNPGAIFPGKKDSILILKRNLLLRKLKRRGLIDDLTLELSMMEPIPAKPLPLPSEAPHLLTSFSKKRKGEHLQSTIDPFWQTRVNELTERHQKRMAQNGVDNVAVLVIDSQDGKVLAYKGNSTHPKAEGHEVDIIMSRRSPGSTLKPILFAAALDQGIIQRETLLPDIPSFFGGFSPKNFSKGYMGAVKANTSLSRSLNIPMVHLLDRYSYQQFHSDLTGWGISTLDQPAGHYGLTLVLGGCEVRPWDVAQVYFSMFRKLAGLPNRTIYYDLPGKNTKSLPLGADAIWQTFKTMTTLARPEGEKSWRSFSSSQLIAWKTGTSHGFRDAWALGINGSVITLVWVGNADGEGRPELTGIKAAAPLLHQVIRLSDYRPDWLSKLEPFMASEELCEISGKLANTNCPKKRAKVTKNSEKTGLCQYHQKVYMDSANRFRISSECYPLRQAKDTTIFILPPIQAYFYAKNDPQYTGMPPLHPECLSSQNPLAIIYPNANSRVLIPTEITGKKGQMILQASHQVAGTPIYWHINDQFLGKTTSDHSMAVTLPPGNHLLTILDRNGSQVSRRFSVVGETK